MSIFTSASWYKKNIDSELKNVSLTIKAPFVLSTDMTVEQATCKLKNILIVNTFEV